MTARQEAIAAAARILAAARAERDELAASGGAEAVAAAAWVPGGPGREQIAATYRSLREQSRPLAAAPAA